MDYINHVISNYHQEIIYNIAYGKINKNDREEFIRKYNKSNYKKCVIHRGNNIINIYQKKIHKYKRIYSAIIIQKKYRDYKIRLNLKKNINTIIVNHNH